MSATAGGFGGYESWRRDVDDWRHGVDGRLGSNEVHVAIVTERQASSDNVVQDLRDEVKTIRRALYSLAASIVVASLIFAFAVVQTRSAPKAPAAAVHVRGTR